MSLFENILSQEVIQKLGWTLVHFLWQAATVALLLAILLRLLRKSTANLRYIIACLALALTILLPVITIRLVSAPMPKQTVHIEPITLTDVSSTELTPKTKISLLEESTQPKAIAKAPPLSLKQRAVELLEPALPYFVSAWLIGVFGLSLWHLGGWAQLQKLRRKMVKQVDASLYQVLNQLTQRLKIKQTVQLVESALVQIPTVVGWIRPIILLPASALTGLTGEQLEAIIAHELAHIKRFDYLINILQTVVEILGFYHPAVWWISYKIRAEREDCCDDLAVSVSGDRVSYAGALTLMEEIRADRGQLAIAATGSNLFRRICRLLGKESNEKTNASWIPAVTVLVLVIALLIPTALALTTNLENKQSEQKSDVQSNAILEKTKSADKLKWLGLALAMYADDNGDNLPQNLQQVKPYIEDEQEYQWLIDNAEYLSKDKTYQPNQPRIPVAYDKTLTEGQSTNVLFMDAHVESVNTTKLKELGIDTSKKTQITIETRFLTVDEDFWQKYIKDANLAPQINPVSGLTLPGQTEPASKTYSILLDDPNADSLVKAAASNKSSKMLAAPSILTHEGGIVQINVAPEELYYVSGYTEPNSPSDEPKPKIDKVESGIHFSATPELTSNRENIILDFELIFTEIQSQQERTYLGKYKHIVPIVTRLSTSTMFVVPNGRTTLIVTQKTGEKVLLMLVKPEVLTPERIKENNRIENFNPNDPLVKKLEEKIKRAARQR